MPTNAPRLLTPEQRAQLVRVPHDLSERQIARYFTLSEADIDLINQRRQPWTRLGFVMWTFRGRVLKSTVGV